MYKLLFTRKNTVYLLIPGSSRLDFAEHNRHEPPSIWGDLLQARAACHKGLAITLRNAIVKNLLGMQQLKDLTISWYFPRAGLISQWSVGITVMRKTIFPRTHTEARNGHPRENRSENIHGWTFGTCFSRWDNVAWISDKVKKGTVFEDFKWRI